MADDNAKKGDKEDDGGRNQRSEKDGADEASHEREKEKAKNQAILANMNPQGDPGEEFKKIVESDKPAKPREDKKKVEQETTPAQTAAQAVPEKPKADTDWLAPFEGNGIGGLPVNEKPGALIRIDDKVELKPNYNPTQTAAPVAIEKPGAGTEQKQGQNQEQRALEEARHSENFKWQWYGPKVRNEQRLYDEITADGEGVTFDLQPKGESYKKGNNPESVDVPKLVEERKVRYTFWEPDKDGNPSNIFVVESNDGSKLTLRRNSSGNVWVIKDGKRMELPESEVAKRYLGDLKGFSRDSEFNNQRQILTRNLSATSYSYDDGRAVISSFATIHGRPGVAAGSRVEAEGVSDIREEPVSVRENSSTQVSEGADAKDTGWRKVYDFTAKEPPLKMEDFEKWTEDEKRLFRTTWEDRQTEAGKAKISELAHKIDISSNKKGLDRAAEIWELRREYNLWNMYHHPENFYSGWKALVGKYPSSQEVIGSAMPDLNNKIRDILHNQAPPTSNEDRKKMTADEVKLYYGGPNFWDTDEGKELTAKLKPERARSLRGMTTERMIYDLYHSDKVNPRFPVGERYTRDILDLLRPYLGRSDEADPTATDSKPALPKSVPTAGEQPSGAGQEDWLKNVNDGWIPKEAAPGVKVPLRDPQATEPAPQTGGTGETNKGAGNSGVEDPVSQESVAPAVPAGAGEPIRVDARGGKIDAKSAIMINRTIAANIEKWQKNENWKIIKQKSPDEIAQALGEMYDKEPAVPYDLNKLQPLNVFNYTDFKDRTLDDLYNQLPESLARIADMNPEEAKRIFETPSGMQLGSKLAEKKAYAEEIGRRRRLKFMWLNDKPGVSTKSVIDAALPYVQPKYRQSIIGSEMPQPDIEKQLYNMYHKPDAFTSSTSPRSVLELLVGFLNSAD